MENLIRNPPQDSEARAEILSKLKLMKLLSNLNTDQNSFLRNGPKYNPETINWADFKARLLNYIETNALYRKNHRLVRHLIYGSMSDKVFSTISSYKPSIEPYFIMTGEEYLTFISTFFAPVLERRWWRLEFEERRQGKDENVILYLSSKWSLFKRLYGETSQLHFDDFRRSCLKGFSNKLVALRVSEQRPDNFDCLMAVVQAAVA